MLIAYNLAKVLFVIVLLHINFVYIQAQEQVIATKNDTSIHSNVTNTPRSGQVLQKSVSISEISNEELNKQGGGSQGLKSIPGLSVVSSSDGPANIRVRGLPGGGYRYVGYMEDGLPVLPTGFYSVPSSDQYFKSDLTVKTVEGTRGGNAPILLSNTPGALINYISKTGADIPYGHFKYTLGLSQQSHRADANVGSKIDSLWHYNAGGFYRTDKGIVPANFISTQGGQFELNLTRQFRSNKGFIRFYGKYLDDKVANAMRGIYAYNNAHLAKAMPGFDIFTQTLVPYDNVFRFNLPEGNAYTSNICEQYHNKLFYGGMLLNVNMGAWDLNNRLRYQAADSRIVADAITGIFTANNISLFQLDGSPFNQSNGYYINHSIKDVTRSDQQMIDYLTFKRYIGKHSFELGAGVYLYNMDSENVNFSFKSTLANQPHVLIVGTNGNVINMASRYDPSGHNQYNGLTTTSSLYFNSDLILSEHVNMNVSARFDNQDITGKKARFDGSSVSDGGTGYVIAGKNEFSDNRNYWSASMGITYNKIKNLSLFTRATRAYNAVNIDDLGSVDVNSENLKNRTVYSLELGDRYNYKHIRFSQSFSYTSIDNLLLVVNIPNVGGSLISQSTFASSRTYSFEMEFGWLILNNLNFQLTSTFQDVEFTQYKFTVKNTAAPEFSGKEVDWKGNVPGSMPAVILQYSLNYTFKNIDIYCKANTTGKIYTTDADTYTLPAYTEVSIGAGYRFFKKYSIRAWANNLFNNRNLVDGNSMGEQFINENTLIAGQLMIGRVILPRSFWLSLEYKF
jgi:outer membrane receptor protein involved in Fe transport